MSARSETWLWLAQRATAALLGICVLVHLVTIVYAARDGLSGSEILMRLQNNYFWLGFYLLFVAAVAIHAPIGIRTILTEHTRLPGNAVNIMTGSFAVLLLWLGVRAVRVLTGL